MCGLSEREALLSAAEEFLTKGKRLEGAGYYQKLLKQEPDNSEILIKLATCLSLESIAQRDELLFEKARIALVRALERDWQWERGHQLRLDLFILFNKPELLLKEYDEIGRNDISKVATCKNMIKIIELAVKFKEEPPEVITSLSSGTESGLLVKSFWFLLLGIPVLLWAIYELSLQSKIKDDKNTLIGLFVFLVLGLAILVLFLLSMNAYRKNRERTKKRL